MPKQKNKMDVVKKALKKAGWSFEEHQGHDGLEAITLAVESRSVFLCYNVRLAIRMGMLSAYYYLPARMTKENSTAAMEYLTRVNGCDPWGKFIMNLDEGQICYVFDDSIPERDQAANWGLQCRLWANAAIVDRYVPDLMAVMLGLKTPGQALKDSEDADRPQTGKSVKPFSPQGKEEKDSSELDLSEIVFDLFGQRKGPAKRGSKKHAAKSAKTAKAEKAKSSGYSLQGLNIIGDIPLEKIVGAVERFRGGRHSEEAPRLHILLSGAPGSGKTAFANYLASAVGAPLRTVRASDLLDSPVGVTEQNIAQVFREAAENGEILFMDEIDSFLKSRQGAQHTWEVTQVNEILQQMESFNGVLIGATNFAESLDDAVLRRFTYKLKLDYLTDEGKDIFFERYFKTPLTDEEKQRLHAIERLTPGDFRTVREGLYYLYDQKPANAEFLKALQSESDAKKRDAPRMGF